MKKVVGQETGTKIIYVTIVGKNIVHSLTIK
jgi:hypothetical protein